MMTGYEKAKIIERTCQELHHQLKITPVVGYVCTQNKQGKTEWREVLCHPEDFEKTDETTFKHPYRDIQEVAA